MLRSWPCPLLLATLAACQPSASTTTSPAGDMPAPGPPAAASPALEAALSESRAGVDDPTLAQLLEDHWRWTLTSQPVFATQLGVHDLDGRLPDPSIEAERDRAAARDGLLERAMSIDAASLSSRDRVTLELFRTELEVDRGAERCRFSRWSMSPRDNPVAEMNGLPELAEVEPEDQLARAKQLPASVDARITRLREGLSEGRVAPADSARRVLEMTRNQLAEPVADWPIMRPVLDGDPALRAAMEALIRDELAPALERFAVFMESELLPSARDDAHPGVMHVPEGPACYEVMIRRYTTLPLSAREIHETGLREMQRINDEMRELGHRLFGTRDLPEILRRLREDPALYFETREEVKAFAEESLAAAKAAIPGHFGVLPQMDCIVTEVPDYEAPFTYIAYYSPAVPDGSKPGEYFINTYQPHTRPRYEARVLALHESIPGHHLQIAISQELGAVPAFRKHGGQTVFVEGWALYTERLGEELGLYRDDLDRMGVLSFDAWRAGRLVVDTGVHAMGWSRQQAIDYLTEHTALATNNIDNEVDRYITWPGQALAYKTGQLEILDLRRKAEAALGDRFDLAAFHDTLLLGGAVSVPVLRQRVQIYLETGEPPTGG